MNKQAMKYAEGTNIFTVVVCCPIKLRNITDNNIAHATSQETGKILAL